METSLFIMLPSPSHYHAAFGLASEIRNSGQRVVFTGTLKVKDAIENEGFEYIYFGYLTEDIIANLKAFTGIFIKSLIDRQYSKQRYKNFLQGQNRLNELVNRIHPNHIYIDEHLSDYSVYLSVNNILVSIICTKLSSRKSRKVPPMNSYFIPNDNIYSNLACEFLWFQRWFIKLYNKFVIKIAFCGNDESIFTERWKKSVNFNKKIRIDEYNYYFKGIKGLPRIILGTNNLEIPWRHRFDDEKYIFFPIERIERKYMTERYKIMINQIMWTKLLDKKKIIYCSFGTVSYKDSSRIVLFMNKLLMIRSEYSDVVLVISKGKLPFQWPEMKDTYYFEYIPQLDFLNYCDLMITHGGHNSIKECYQKGIRMLVYPHMEDNDQPGNAVRVQLNKLGLMGNIKKDSSAEIWSKINYILRKFPKPHIPIL